VRKQKVVYAVDFKEIVFQAKIAFVKICYFSLGSELYANSSL